LTKRGALVDGALIVGISQGNGANKTFHTNSKGIIAPRTDGLMV